MKRGINLPGDEQNVQWSALSPVRGWVQQPFTRTRRRIPHASTPTGSALRSESRAQLRHTCMQPNNFTDCVGFSKSTYQFQKSTQSILSSHNTIRSFETETQTVLVYAADTTWRIRAVLLWWVQLFRNSKGSRAQWNPSGGPATPHRYPSSGRRRMATGRPRSSHQHQRRSLLSQLEQHMRAAPTSRWGRKAGGDSLATT